MNYALLKFIKCYKNRTLLPNRISALFKQIVNGILSLHSICTDKPQISCTNKHENDEKIPLKLKIIMLINKPFVLSCQNLKQPVFFTVT